MTKFLHTCVRVKDLEASLQFYQEALGFKEVIAVGVDDLEATHQAHKEAGYNVTDLSGLPGKPKMYYFITDPDGYKIEVIRLAQFLEK